MIKTLALIGMMGSGKSRLGVLLAERLNRPFVDCDSEIEKAAGCSIADIFSIYGEEAFRDLEEKILARLVHLPEPQVIATGGGVVLRQTNRDLLKSDTVAIWLQAPVDTLLERTMGNTKRPLLQTADPAARLRDLLDKRENLYAETAAVVFENNGQNVQHAVNQIMQSLEKMA